MSVAPHIRGYERLVYVMNEATYAEETYPAAKNALRVKKCTLNFSQDAQPRNDGGISDGIASTIKGFKTADWSIEAEVIPSGAVGVAADIARLLKATFGACLHTQAITFVFDTALEDKTITITIDGTPVVLTEGEGGGQWDAASNSETTAHNFFALVNSLTATTLQGITATHLAGVVTLTIPANIYRVAITSNASTSYVKLDTPQGTGYKFTRTATEGEGGSLTIYKILSAMHAEMMTGCVVDEMKIVAPGGGRPTITFSGGGSDFIETGYALTVGGLSGAEVSVTVSTGQGIRFQSGSYIQVGTSTALKVTAVTGDVLTLDAATPISGAQDEGSVVKPYYPTETTYGTPAVGIAGSVMLGIDTVPVTNFELTFKRNNETIRNEFGKAVASGAVDNKKVCTGSFTCRCRRDLAAYYYARKSFTAEAITVCMGGWPGTPPNNIWFYMPKAELQFKGTLEEPEDKECSFTLEFQALESSQGAHDELIMGTN
jgi:hypothetical protein